MSQATQEDARLHWDLVDRLHKALRVSGVSNADMAAALGVHRNTVSNYLRGSRIDRRTLVVWALTCGVPFDWLAGIPQGDGNKGLPRLDSNQEPAGFLGSPKHRALRVLGESKAA